MPSSRANAPNALLLCLPWLGLLGWGHRWDRGSRCDTRGSSPFSGYALVSGGDTRAHGEQGYARWARAPYGLPAFEPR